MIPLTQYLMPDGRPRKMHVERPPEVEALTQTILDRGGYFDAEVLRTGEVSFTVEHDDEAISGGLPIAIEVVPNGPAVPDAIDRLVSAAHERLTQAALS